MKKTLSICLLAASLIAARGIDLRPSFTSLSGPTNLTTVLVTNANDRPVHVQLFDMAGTNEFRITPDPVGQFPVGSNAPVYSYMPVRAISHGQVIRPGMVGYFTVNTNVTHGLGVLSSGAVGVGF